MVTSEGTRVLLDETFADGLGVGERWLYVEAPGFVSDDGTATTSAAGLSVSPPGRHPDTGEPMFTKEASGFAGHLKWMVFTTRTFPTGEGPLRVRFRGGARCFGLERHPYGPAVADPARDIRLGSATLNVLDFDSGLVFDFWVGSSVVVPFYERLRPPGVPAAHAAFGSVGDPVPHSPGDVHDFAITVDAAAGTATWELDGTVVGRVDRLGPPSPGWTTVLDHGGTPQVVSPGQLQVGLGLMTLLDAALPPSGEGLVDIGAPGLVRPARFAATGPALFGQGVRLDVERIVVDRP